MTVFMRLSAFSAMTGKDRGAWAPVEVSATSVGYSVMVPTPLSPDNISIFCKTCSDTAFSGSFHPPPDGLF